MERRSFIKTTAAMMIAAPAGLAAGSASAQDKKFTIALIPGLTTDAFYITMRKGADLVVVGESGKGTKSTDRYTLKGLSQALDRVAAECK